MQKVIPLGGSEGVMLLGLTCAGGSWHTMGAVLGDGLDGQLVLAQGSLRHYGNRLKGRGRGAALDDAAGAP
jgi:hypothetical protein